MTYPTDRSPALLPEMGTTRDQRRALMWWPALSAALLIVAMPGAGAAQLDIAGPPGSITFGGEVTVLPNGNFVVTDSDGPSTVVGAVHLYRPDGTLISTLTGSVAGDRVGRDGITVLATGHFVVSSRLWNNGPISGAGAVTWVNADTGLQGEVSPTNSLVGTSTSDRVGEVTALPNGHYVVNSPSWDNGAGEDIGAVTWANGNAGLAGEVSAANSLVGSSPEDQVGSSGVFVLGNGHYVVVSIQWSNGLLDSAGAVTWVNGNSGLIGEVSAANSLVGSQDGDSIGSAGITALSNGNYVVGSNDWKNGPVNSAGAATWADGSSGVVGMVSALNSLVGTSDDDEVGIAVTALSNGHYVVSSPAWSLGATPNVGAATWGDGDSGSSGAVSQANSLTGTSAEDQVGLRVFALGNGNYVVTSPNWNRNATIDVGAATWADGSSGLTGVVSISNSLIGRTANDEVGSQGVTPVGNGHYVVTSPSWSNAATIRVGAVTWANGDTGISGEVSPGNSLIGSSADDRIGLSSTRALANGNYVVLSPNWHNGASTNAGAVTWGDGDVGLIGEVSATNSLVGASTNHYVGYRVIVLSNGNYVIPSAFWDDGATADVGALTWANGSTGLSGPVSATNSLIGANVADRVGNDSSVAYSDGNYAIRSEFWDNGAISDAGAITFGPGDGPMLGTIDASNSVLGGAMNAGADLSFAYNPQHYQLVVGRPAENIVSLFGLPRPEVFSDGFE